MKLRTCRAARVAMLGVMALMAAGIPACQHRPDPTEPPDHVPPAFPASLAPAYAEVAARYNARAEKLNRLFARAVIRLTYKDEKGESHTDQGEGLLQMIRPTRVALSIKKVSKMLFWFGCDDQRYWFFDVVDEKIARVGKHAKPGGGGEDRTDAAGIAIPPRELFELIGMTPLDASAAGKTAWAADGKSVQVTVPRLQGGTRVFTLDPSTLEPQRIEHRASTGATIISADLRAYEGVELTGVGGRMPRLATQIDAVHKESDTRIRLDLSELKDSGISEKAFVFDELCRALGVEKIIDVDARPAGPAPGGK